MKWDIDAPTEAVQQAIIALEASMSYDPPVSWKDHYQIVSAWLRKGSESYRVRVSHYGSSWILLFYLIGGSALILAAPESKQSWVTGFVVSATVVPTLVEWIRHEIERQRSNMPSRTKWRWRQRAIAVALSREEMATSLGLEGLDLYAKAA